MTPKIRLVRAANPSPLTGDGTNTWIIGSGRVAVIDPGPALDSHLDAIRAALDPHETISHILVTHAHLDHTALVPALSRLSGAPVLAFGPAISGRSPVMERLITQGFVSGGEGADTGFAPDHQIGDGAVIEGDDWQITALHTPGHMGGHLCFATDKTLFSGDHVMGWSSTIVSPPDGDMGAYMASLHRLAQSRWDRMLPGHGPAIEAPAERIATLIAHRRDREAQILQALHHGPDNAAGLAARIYTDTPPRLLPAASRNVLAHLIDLNERKEVSTDTALHPESRFFLR